MTNKNLGGFLFKRPVFVFLLVAVLFFGLIVIIRTPSPVIFEQFLIQDLQIKNRVDFWKTLSERMVSTYSYGFRSIFNSPKKEFPALDDVGGVFDYVWSRLPPQAYVYPTEGFYYWLVKSGDGEGKEVWGNIRVANLDQGKLSFVFYEKQTSGSGYFQSKDFTVADGLQIKKISDFAYDVTINGRTVHFHLFARALSPLPDFPLIAGEEFVGRILDESGVRFILLYNNETNSFYEVLDEAVGLTEALLPVEGSNNLLIGVRTDFVFYRDDSSQRQLLVGVNLEHVEANDYLDGPGDQVPFRLDFKEKLNKAYPNTLLGDGTDEHGVYLNKPEWVRIAVSPYHRYGQLSELVDRDKACSEDKDKSVLWTCLTKEWWNNGLWRQGIFDQLKTESKYDSLLKQGLIIP